MAVVDDAAGGGARIPLRDWCPLRDRLHGLPSPATGLPRTGIPGCGIDGVSRLDVGRGTPSCGHHPRLRRLRLFRSNNHDQNSRSQPTETNRGTIPPCWTDSLVRAWAGLVQAIAMKCPWPLCSIALSLTASVWLPAAEPAVFNPKIEPASDAPAKAMRGMKLPDGFGIELFAAEPMVSSPVGIAVDEKGAVYAAETFRHGTSVRGHFEWLEEDLAARTVADRVAFTRRLAPDISLYTREHERVRMLVDTDGDGRADRSTVFADGFNDIAAGLGADVMARRGKVYFACVPDLWLLEDKDGDGRADERKSLHHGYGVHIGYTAHDLHGLEMGPDGKIYFTMADRGMHVEHEGKTFAYPDTGTALRCNPDGSELEVFATGLRNPQDLAFDEFGNLFTGDNNADGGDKARVVYIVEGGDSGWRIGYQFIPPDIRPWNAERLWHLPFSEQAAYLIPPIGHLASGPSGLEYYPGLGFGEAYRGSFLLCDYRYSPTASTLFRFTVRPQGAGFEMGVVESFLKGAVPTDVEFGPDGCLYVSEMDGAPPSVNRGRVYRVFDRLRRTEAAVVEMKALFAAGFESRSEAELEKLLTHADMRVRLEAQFALAERGAASVFARVLQNSEHRLARLHAIWGVGQLARKTSSAAALVAEALEDGDPEVRAQVVKVLGEARYLASFDALTARLKDQSSRVRFFSAISLGKLGRSEAVDPLLGMLRENSGNDPYLRHAGSMGLAGTGAPEKLLSAVRRASSAERMGVLLALRRLQHPGVAEFLNDSDPLLVVEAARAIYDMPITPALPALAGLWNSSRVRLTGGGEASRALIRRVLSANYRLGHAAHAQVLADMANEPQMTAAFRVEAIELLTRWAAPSGRDSYLGIWRPVASRPGNVAREALRGSIGILLTQTADIAVAAARFAADHGLDEASNALVEAVQAAGSPPELGTAALQALDKLGSKRLTEAVMLASESPHAALQAEASRLIPRIAPDKAVELLEKSLKSSSIRVQQSALTSLAALPVSRSDDVLLSHFERMEKGELRPELHLELLTAMGARQTPELKARLAARTRGFLSTDPLAGYRETLAGGDAGRGRKIFFDKAEAQCVRCHVVEKTGGEVGPDLSALATRASREQILESLLDPNRSIVPGYANIELTLKNEESVTGVLKSDGPEAVELVELSGKKVRISKDEIVGRREGLSSMPTNMAEFLTKAEIRDLVEFLANLGIPKKL
ncbi:MAG: c-type cytochrome [Verrucomicrobia bacterium]|nr:c-type cytochrome [Verrucomicrobiota bacterium]